MRQLLSVVEAKGKVEAAVDGVQTRYSSFYSSTLY